jgi:serine/threonine-protein kinase
MGRVYLARHTTLDKRVALKVLHSDYRNDRQFGAFFLREARTASKLSHPNVVQVIDFGEEPDGLLYIVMELLEGESLADMIAAGPIDFPRVTRIMGQVCAALGAAHEVGLVHRDMKPGNIVVVRDVDDLGAPVERIKVCDFGLAKMVDPSSTRASHVAGTQVGVVKGTPQYMSPEQARGERVDMRSDLYACGIILYELLTRTLPFNADTAMGVLTRQVLDPPTPPSRLNPAITPTLEAVVLKALAKDPAARHQNMRELRDELIAAMRAETAAGPRRDSPPAVAAPEPQNDARAAAPARAPAPRAAAPGVPFVAVAPAQPAQSAPRRVAPLNHASSGLSEFCLALANTLVCAAIAPGSADFERTIGELSAVGAHLLPGREEMTLLLQVANQRPVLMLQTGPRAPFELKKVVNPDYFNAFASPLIEAFVRRRLAAVTFREPVDPAELFEVVGLLGAADVPAEQAAAALNMRMLRGIVPTFESDLVGHERELPREVDIRLSRLARDLRISRQAGGDPAAVEAMRRGLFVELVNFPTDGLFLVLLNFDLAGNAGSSAVQEVLGAMALPAVVRVATLALGTVDAAAAEGAARATAARALLDLVRPRLCTERSPEGDQLLRAMQQRSFVQLAELPRDLQLGAVAEHRAETLAQTPERLLESIRMAADAVYVREVGILEHALRVVAARGHLAALTTTLTWLRQQASAGRGGDARSSAAAAALRAVSDPELMRPIASTLLSSANETELALASDALAAAGGPAAQALIAARAASTDQAVRVRFVSGMRKLGAAAVPAVTAALVDSAKSRAADPRFVEDLLRSVPDVRNEELGTAVAPYVQTNRAAVKRAAVVALAATWGEQARSDVIDALKDEDDGVRSAAFTAVRDLGLVDGDVVKVADDVLSGTVTANDESKAAAAAALARAEGTVADLAMEVLDRALAPRGRSLTQVMRMESQALPSPPVLEAIVRSLYAVGGGLGRKVFERRIQQLPREVKDRLVRIAIKIESSS